MTVHMLSLVLPVYNFAAGLPSTLQRLREATAKLPQPLEIIIVDDGSTDGTGNLLGDLDAPFVVVRLPENRGKGAALRAGMLKSTGQNVVLTDIDVPYGLEPVTRALVLLQEGDIVIGSRYHENKEGEVSRRMGRRLGSRIFVLLARIALGRSFTDTQCGLKVLRGEVARSLAAKLTRAGFAIDVELLALAIKEGYRIEELQVRQIDDAPSTIRFKHLVQMVSDLALIFWRYRISI